MSYSRPPNTIFTGTALNQTPQAIPLSPAGWVPETISANIATTNSLGVVQVGNNLSITPSGILSATTPIGVPGYYGAFYDTTIQTNPVVNEVNIMRLNSIDIASGISVAAGTQITAANPGIYDLQFSAQLSKTTGADHDIDIWLRKNGADVPYTNTRVTLFGSNSKAVAAWNYLLSLAAGDYVELAWSSAFSTMEILAAPPQTDPIRPGIASLIVTLTQVSTT